MNEFSVYTPIKYNRPDWISFGWRKNLERDSYMWLFTDGSKHLTHELFKIGCDVLDSVLYQWEEENKNSYTTNRAVVAHNKAVFDRIVGIMGYVGLGDYDVASDGSRTMLHWKKELAKKIPLDCGYEAERRKIVDYIDSMKEIGRRALAGVKEGDAPKLELDKKEYAQMVQELAIVCYRNNVLDAIAFEPRWVVERLLDLDKYLRLAHNLSCAVEERDEWETRLLDNLRDFDVKSELDAEIVGTIFKAYNSVQDTSMFLRITYNPEYLFGLVGSRLLEGYRTALGWLRRV